MTSSAHPTPLGGIEIDVTIVQGRNLVAKDRSLFGKKKASDPYVIFSFGGKKYGKTKTISKTLSPVWKESYKIVLGSDKANAVLRRQGTGGKKNPLALQFHIFDKDRMKDDPMGTVTVPPPLDSPPSTKWYNVEEGTGENRCKDASGQLEIEISVSGRKMLSLVSGNSQPISGTIRVGLGWEMETRHGIDLDTSCVGIDAHGNILMDETVYFGDLVNSNRSIIHSGDEREGDEDLDGSGDDEVVTVDLSRVPARVKALYFIATVATPGKTFADVKSALVRITDNTTMMGLSIFVPSHSGENTALFLARVARNNPGAGGGWVFSPIGDSDHTARDFGSLIPEIKGYSRDLVPGIKIDKNERVAIMRKGGTIRLRDYTRGDVPASVTFGLAWDITRGRNIDLDASAICLNSSLSLVETVSYSHLTSSDGSIRHGGDEREGDEKGDDEKIHLSLANVHSSVQYIGFVVNSYSGEELDDVKDASCHLFDTRTGVDIAQYKLSNSKELDKHTALVMGCLYRGDNSMWFLRIISEAAKGRVAKDNVDELQFYLRRFPICPKQPSSSPPDPEIVLNEMPSSIPIDEEIVLGETVPIYQMQNPMIPTVTAMPTVIAMPTVTAMPTGTSAPTVTTIPTVTAVPYQE